MSDTMVGALWVADALFAFGLAGAKAFHLHWGIGGDPSGSLGQPNTGVQTNFLLDVSNARYNVIYLAAFYAFDNTTYTIQCTHTLIAYVFGMYSICIAHHACM